MAKNKKVKAVRTKKKRTTKTAKARIVSKTIPEPTPHWNIRVSRFNPQMDFVPRTHEYKAIPHEGESVLDLLTRLKHTQDGSLTFRGSCGYGGCGSCGVTVNGKPVLGCVTQVTDVLDANNNLRVDPLNKENVIKDLVCDESIFFKELLKVKPWLVTRKGEERRNHKMGINDVSAMKDAPQCILCGICNAHTESSKLGELGPAAFVKAYRYTFDSRDGDSSRILALASSLPVHYSLEKANLCPRNIFPGDKISEMRDIQKAKKAKENSRKRSP